MIGRKRHVVESNADYTPEFSPNATPAKNRKSFAHPGKENIPPSSFNSKGIGGFSQAFHQTEGECYPCAQTQAEHLSLSKLDPVLTLGNSELDSQWTDSCAGSSLDELDSEILESSSLAELDSEILEGSSLSFRSPYEPQKVYHSSFKLVSCQSRSIESRLLSLSVGKEDGDRDGDGDKSAGVGHEDEDEDESDFESTQFGVLMKLCAGEDEISPPEPGPVLVCPLCGLNISDLNEESRQFHANECLDKSFAPKEVPHIDAKKQPSQCSDRPSVQSSAQAAAEAPVIKWLHSLGLAKYEAAFIQQEIDWDSLQWLTEEDLTAMGVTALGPRKKIMQSLKELRKRDNNSTQQRNSASEHSADMTKSLAVNKLITDFFPSPLSGKKNLTRSGQQQMEKGKSNSNQRRVPVRNTVNWKNKDVPLWCSIPGTPFLVDAFRYLRRDCSHWFLTHFHIDHYQGLTRSFSYGKIYCSMITAKLVNTKIGIPWDKLQVMPLNQKINVAGVDVSCYDANHCPGSIIILFEPPTGKAVLHTGDFRFSEEMAAMPALQDRRIHTVILDTTYCNPQYNFPKQEVVVQFVIEAIQAESFNPKTLFLIGSYTIGKERVFLEVARALRKKIYVPAAKLRLLDCLELPAEDMHWFTLNEHESNIHVVPMWTISSFKRLKQLSCQYTERFSLIVAFSPTGWTLGQGKKSAGRRRQQGTIIRYEVPYSEHCSFEELKEFVKLLSPLKIIPSVNNQGEESSNAMVDLLLS